MFKQIVKEELKVPAHIDYLADLREFISRIGKKYGFSEKVIKNFKVAIDEAATNVIRHAYREVEGGGSILIRALIKKNSLTICLIDQGKYFDPKHVQAPDLQRYVQIGKRGGLGIFMMRKLMDEVDYRKTEEGNELRLTKMRDSARLHRGLAKPIASAVKAIPFSLKAKYWLRTFGILLTVITAGYFYSFFMLERTEREAFLNTLRAVESQVTKALREQPEVLDDVTGDALVNLLGSLYRPYNNLLYDIVLVNEHDEIIGHNNTAALFLPYSKSVTPGEVVADGIQLYQAPGIINPPAGPTEVYDLTSVLPVKDAMGGTKTLHVRGAAAYLRARVAAQRWEQARFAIVVTVAAGIGSFLLIYMLMNPLRKLTEWIRRAGHGELGDEMDIDDSSEIGEIAQAFSEITSKFRESQKNLADQERLQREMQVAQEIQQTLLPSDFPELEGYELASYYEAAREVGGDYYDFVEVDKDTLGVVVADVSGKGVPGSLVMTMIRTALRTEARGVKDAAEVLTRVNKFVSGDVKKGMFVTLFYVIIDSKRRRLNYASAGHNPMILYRASTKRTYYLNPRGFPVGIQLPDEDLFRKSIESDTIQLMEDDILLIYTDGITEAMNSRRELFGEERLLKIIRDYGHLRVKPFVEKIKDEILSFTEGAPQSDDITLVAIKEKTSPEKEELRRAKQAHLAILAGASIRVACETAGITTYAYYNKYKKEFEEKGFENFEIDSETSVEAKHIAIEDKIKIYDIIKHNPEFGAKRISEELNTEKYDFCVISENKIYDELVRSRLNTRQLREAFVARGMRSKRPMKPPGTPMLTLKGEVIITRPPAGEPVPAESKTKLPSEKPATIEPPARERQARVVPEKSPVETPVVISRRRRDSAKTGGESGVPVHEPVAEQVPPPDLSVDPTIFDFNAAPETPVADSTTTGGLDAIAATDLDFAELFAGSSVIDEPTVPPAVVPEPPDIAPVVLPEPAVQDARSGGRPREEDSSGLILNRGDDDIYSAVDDLLQSEIESNFGFEDGTPAADTPPANGAHEDTSPAPAALTGTTPPITTETSALPFVEVDELLQYDFTGAPGESPVAEAQPPTGHVEQSVPVSAAPPADASPAVVTAKFRSAADAAPAPAPAPLAAPPPSGRNGEPSEEEREKLLITGLRYYKRGQFDEAIAEFRQTIARYPNFKEAHSILGNAYFRNRMYEEARRAYQRVKELDPSDTTAYENMGVIFANRGEYLEAMREWQRVLEIDPSRDDIRRKIELAARMMMKRAPA
ncbi:MAG: SpoIIE family protein phosphatase [candidate division KSB1 bacterium]|nr:SpoIIE family protein phosphatase [candidate division KSB1 bacterium]MDZ7274464.1 SpoIIE family protein phosphatase [candidate division KSB1 bacterium]MDZ7284874.1 SpoIIE family protein phosphatase [candidate division KSB1 bacterium]MDZ7297705.1 SpoIIE family protein phosphatase [candidate division KSB1 bacterium]MDZ7308275.1 SpoIIE family protein phosphatase [candidate division KSB1 bacterium]